MGLPRSNDLDDSNERNHDDHDGEHEPADTIRPLRVDVLTERNRRVVDHSEHEQKLHSHNTKLIHLDLTIMQETVPLCYISLCNFAFAYGMLEIIAII